LTLASAAFAIHQANANQISFSLSSINPDGLVGTGAGIAFNEVSGQFSFFNSTNAGLANGNSFQLSDGLYGTIGGTYQLGTIGTTPTGDAMAPVTLASGAGTNVITIKDNTGHNLTANVVWNNVVDPNGSSGTLNIAASLNLSGMAYTGSNVDLLALLHDGNGTGTSVVSFTFLPAISLSTLDKGGTDTNKTTSFSGSISSTPDGGSAVALLGIALLGVEMFRRKLVHA
jgi:hypothetical protein